MNRDWLAGLALVGLAATAAGDDGGSLCTRLADEARRAPASAWAAPSPLANWMKPAPAAAPSAQADGLARDARWREQLAASEGQVVGVQQLAGAPVFLLETFAGTATCQSLVLVAAPPGQPSRQLEPPFSLDGWDLCTTRSAGFFQVLGRPAFVVGGAPSMTSPDFHYRIATWAGQGWGQRCSVTLKRQVAMTAAQRFCAPGGRVCEAGQPVARRLAQAYELARAANRPLDEVAFNGGRRPDAAVAAALNPPLAESGAVGDMNPPFPLFGADEKRLDAMLTVFSNADPRVLPVRVEGRWWLAVVGRSGVGWREGAAVLVALFAPPGRAADGVASYQFLVRPTGLLDAAASDERP
ncbi:hypothetical protein [Roseateles sp.]|uniref:hypothetical protein n=1 Tax=Roseateles sp. TaxID=1971397 RepID=UPI0025E372D9|nr:hypothetical protein [Roseateles sp.]MBV8033766.1 hypothetical protein [Roseateles sp.]